MIRFDAVDYIRRRHEMFLESWPPTGLSLRDYILDDLVTLCIDSRTARTGDWFVVFSNKIWTAPENFFSIVPIPGYINSMRSEILLTAFARDVLLGDEKTNKIIIGDKDNFNMSWWEDDLWIEDGWLKQFVAFRM